ncbi:MAG: class III extradiol ring-cleavage dioxygenase [Pseudomonadota bacterium]
MRGLFLSHGAPDVLLGAHPARRFWRELGQRLARPSAVVVISAHHERREVEVSADPAPGTVYDFSGFPEALYHLRYPAPGSPTLARQLVRALTVSTLEESLRLAPRRGRDHGAWVPLFELFPAADVPVVQVSVLRQREGESPSTLAQRHVALGRALGAALPDDTLFIGSGSLTHGLADRAGTGEVPWWVEAFRAWVRERMEAKDLEALVAYRERAPHAARNHPTPEHLMPLFVTLGAFEHEAPVHLHDSTMYDVLAMDAYGWR